jgi:putative endonuclease
MTDTKTKGRTGEDIATNFLEAKGYKIRKRNFHFGRTAEIDIVAMLDDLCVFVEVKMRTNDKYGNPLESITPAKQKKIKRAAEGFLYVNKLQNTPCRFDVIVLDFLQGHNEITHYENAF